MRPVRSITTVLFILALTSYATADDAATSPAVETGIVDLSINETVEIHRRGDDITRICRAGYGVKGCTDFPVEHLTCECELHGDHWVIDARAEIEAVIHLSRGYATSPVLTHERMHLVDLEDALHKHLEGIASTQYQSEKACRTYARVLTITPHLRVVMNDIRIRSNEKYGCSSKTH